MKNLKSAIVLILSIFSFVISGVHADILRVPEDFPIIQDAIDSSVTGDIILLADGEYDQNIFVDKAISIRSTNGPDRCILLGDITNRLFEFHGVKSGWAELNGVTIGGFTEPTAFYMGILDIEQSAVEVTNCVFNKIITTSPMAPGTIISVRDSFVRFSETRISNNECSSFIGPGVTVYALSSQIQMDHCLIQKNSESGGLFGENSYFEIDSCIITENTSTKSGGGIELSRSGLRLMNSILSRNSAIYHGGGICLHNDSWAEIGGNSSFGNTFSDNQAGKGNHLYLDPDSSLVINTRNNTFLSPRNETQIYPLDHFDLTHSLFVESSVDQDIYVSPTGNDGNDGLSPETPLKTITMALALVNPDSVNPITIHTANGSYSFTENRELFPLTIPENVYLKGEDSAETILDAEGANSVVVLNGAISDAVIRNGSGINGGGLNILSSDAAVFNCSILDCQAEYGGGIYIDRYSPTIHDCVIQGNKAMHSGGGICCLGGNPVIYNAVVSYNQGKTGAGIYLQEKSEAQFLNTQIYSNYCTSTGGGVYCQNSAPEFLNCLLFANQAADCCGAMYFGDFSEPFLSNVTVTVNRSNSIGGIGCFSSFPELINCIIYFNTDSDFDLDESIANVTYSDIDDGFPGEGNIDQSPLFVEGFENPFCLSHVEAGQSTTSPCVNSGKGNAFEEVHQYLGNPIPMSRFTTRSDFSADESRLDMGYHGPAKSINLVPSVKIQMNDNYQPGDRVKITGVLSNPSLEVLTRPLVYMVKIGGEMFFFPGGQSVSNELHYEVISILPGMHKRLILPEFIWPDTGESFDLDCWIYGAFLTSDLTEIDGIFTVNNWSYGPVE